MNKEKEKENIRFFLKVTFAHVFTYIFCGVIAMTLFNYIEWIAEQENWREQNDIMYAFALPLQLVRGALYGIALLLLKDTLLQSKYGMIKLYLIMIILGIFNTSAPSSGSIEAFIYLVPSNEPLGVKLGGMAEILIQNLLFCVIVCTKWKKQKKNSFKCNSSL